MLSCAADSSMGDWDVDKKGRTDFLCERLENQWQRLSGSCFQFERSLACGGV